MKKKSRKRNDQNVPWVCSSYSRPDHLHAHHHHPFCFFSFFRGSLLSFSENGLLATLLCWFLYSIAQYEGSRWEGRNHFIEKGERLFSEEHVTCVLLNLVLGLNGTASHESLTSLFFFFSSGRRWRKRNELQSIIECDFSSSSFPLFDSRGLSLHLPVLLFFWCFSLPLDFGSLRVMLLLCSLFLFDSISRFPSFCGHDSWEEKDDAKGVLCLHNNQQEVSCMKHKTKVSYLLEAGKEVGKKGKYLLCCHDAHFVIHCLFSFSSWTKIMCCCCFCFAFPENHFSQVIEDEEGQRMRVTDTLDSWTTRIIFFFEVGFPLLFKRMLSCSGRT